jgi:hypothetical protein
VDKTFDLLRRQVREGSLEPQLLSMLHNLLLIPSDKQTAADRWGVLLHNTHQVATLGAEEGEKDGGVAEDGDEGGSSAQHARWRIGPHELHRCY